MYAIRSYYGLAVDRDSDDTTALVAEAGDVGQQAGSAAGLEIHVRVRVGHAPDQAVTAQFPQDLRGRILTGIAGGTGTHLQGHLPAQRRQVQGDDVVET